MTFKIGWTLWNISIGALFVGSNVILYDGSPFYPTAEVFLEMLFKHKCVALFQPVKANEHAHQIKGLHLSALALVIIQNFKN